MSGFIFVAVLLVVGGVVAYKNKDKLLPLLQRLKDKLSKKPEVAKPEDIDLRVLDGTDKAPVDITPENMSGEAGRQLYNRLFGGGAAQGWEQFRDSQQGQAPSDPSYKDGNVIPFNGQGHWIRVAGKPGARETRQFTATETRLVQLHGDRLASSAEIGGWGSGRVFVVNDLNQMVVGEIEVSNTWSTPNFVVEQGRTYFLHILLIEGGATSVQIRFMDEPTAPVNTGR